MTEKSDCSTALMLLGFLMCQTSNTTIRLENIMNSNSAWHDVCPCWVSDVVETHNATCSFHPAAPQQEHEDEL
jgi:hypothetical protein